MKIIERYLDSIKARYQAGNATEHSFRADLQRLIEEMVPGIYATNEPKRQACGAPDYILTRNNIPIGFIEAKDIGDKDLEGVKKTGNKEQFDRYKASLNNIIFTDYLDFHLYREGKLVRKAAIGKVVEKEILPLAENFEAFACLIGDFCAYPGQGIKSAPKLAEIMASKARLLAHILEKALTGDENNEENSELKSQMTAFRQILIHDITAKDFADVYAQTIAYGLFAARLYDTRPDTFSRQKAAELIPKSNPFLRKLFGYIAGPDIDDRIKWIVDDLADIFLYCNVREILKDYGKTTQTEDPIIHFYETFLSIYDPKLRKTRGVWYTPKPAVEFIIRAVDDILQTEFQLPKGLADSEKIKIKVSQEGKKIEKETHRLQILDPAAGTGAFLAEVIKKIHQKFQGQQGLWSGYVEKHLLPRLNGFEILMASYAIAHLQLDLLLSETSYKPAGNQRLRIYLTNSLEESHPDTGTLFAAWLSAEANEANFIKRDTPIMCVIGNPPYSGESANKNPWIMQLMEDYKKEPGGKQKLKERNPKWLNDDYVKFLRYAQYFIEKNGEGVVAFINPHGFLDNPTFRGMRWRLLKTYDKIYILDLHGNSKKQETAPDGSPDENIFDIMQGVSINLFIKTGKKKSNELAKVFHYDVYGKRAAKYRFLSQNSLYTIPYQELSLEAPYYYFVNKNFEAKKQYEKGFSIAELFPLSSVGIVTARDSFVIQFSKEQVRNVIETFLSLDKEDARSKFKLGKDVRDWKVDYAKKDLKNNYPNKGIFAGILYRPFDQRYTFYTGNSRGFHCYPRAEVMQHMLAGENVALALCKQFKTGDNYCHVFIANRIIESCYVSNKTSEITSIFPLYLYPETNDFYTLEGKENRKPNLNPEIIRKIAENLGLVFTPEKEAQENTFAPIDVLDYVYAVLHSPSYRQKYKTFLKIDFPRVPYPKNKSVFGRLAELGGQLRQIHLLESPLVERLITEYPIEGDNKIERPRYQEGKVFINPTQYFDKVPQEVCEFYIGSYQPAQKWLKDRKDCKLEFEDILHYQKIIVALTQTVRLMQEIDKIDGIL
jgi:predicted helicase